MLSGWFPVWTMEDEYTEEFDVDDDCDGCHHGVGFDEECENCDDEEDEGCGYY